MKTIMDMERQFIEDENNFEYTEEELTIEFKDIIRILFFKIIWLKKIKINWKSYIFKYINIFLIESKYKYYNFFAEIFKSDYT